ncbi:MAG: pyridoxal-phosphate dependent enzyme [Ignisphaera sp.]
MEASWICRSCGFRANIFDGYYWRCPVCGSPIDISYEPVYEFGGRGLDRFRGLLPFTPDRYRGEGETKLVEETIDGVKLLLKLEYMNPSGSFKDRGSALSIYYAYRMGFRRVVEDSSGNAGLSVALYSLVYGLKPTIIIPKTVSRSKRDLIRVVGGDVVEVDTRRDAALYAAKLSLTGFYVAHTWSPLYIYGSATIAFEVYEEVGEPDAVIAPAGSGGLLLGIIKGFEILKKLGKGKRFPGP